MSRALHLAAQILGYLVIVAGITGLAVPSALQMATVTVMIAGALSVLARVFASHPLDESRNRGRVARRRLARVQDDAGNVDDATRARVGRIQRLHDEVEALVGAPDVPGYVRQTLADAARDMEPLAAQAANLAARRAALAASLEHVSLPALRREQTALRVRRDHAATSDPALHAQLDQTLRFKTEEIEAYEAIAQTLRRVDGQLESVESAFAAFKARVLRFKSEGEAGEWARAAGDDLRAGRDLSALSRQMDALDGSVREVLALRAGSGAGGAA